LLTCSKFSDLIHIFQVHARSRKETVLPLSTLNNSYSQKAYGVKLPQNYDINSFVEIAVQKNIIVAADNGTTERAFKLTAIPANWEIKLPKKTEHLLEEIPNLERAWREFMTWLVCHMSGKQKREQLQKKLAEWPGLKDIPTESLDALLALSVFRGILLVQEDGTFKRNKIPDIVPVDYTSFPGNYIPIFKDSERPKSTTIVTPVVSLGSSPKKVEKFFFPKKDKKELGAELEKDKADKRKSDNPKKKK